jgi:hypothetical protein
MLWGKWQLYFPVSRDRVDVTPLRTGQIHLNATKLLEIDCPDCLQVKNIKNNGDGTINMDVTIRHPWPKNTEFTAFDVKGIIMFEGSLEFIYKPDYIVEYAPNNYIPVVSWRELGDPELLNEDGYTFRWSPQWQTGSELPIHNYYEGKYTTGTPTANINGYLDFYSLEDRHIFNVDSAITRTYHLWLPPGEPVVAGYAIEANWASPDVMPVTDPVNDFPESANQSEAYWFKFVINNGEPLTKEEYCCGNDYIGDCSDLRVEMMDWGGVSAGFDGNTSIYILKPIGSGSGQQGPMYDCEPPIIDIYWPWPFGFTDKDDGNYRYLVMNADGKNGKYYDRVYDLADFTIKTK